MATVEIFIPDELLPMAQDLTRFWSAMVYKLRKNAHKGKWEDLDLDQTMGRLENEVSELDLAIAEKSFCEILLEGADVANFAMIATSVALSEVGRPATSVLHVVSRVPPSSSPDGASPAEAPVTATSAPADASEPPATPPRPAPAKWPSGTVAPSQRGALEEMFGKGGLVTRK